MFAALPFPDIGPEIFSVTLFGRDFALRWYATAYIVGIIIGWRFVIAAIRRPSLWRGQTPALSEQQLESLLTWIIVGIIGGGRLGYVLFYQPAYFLANPAEILAVWQGGMSFHGGFLGVVLAILIFARREGLVLGSISDSIALASPPALLLGRISNFINGELWGRPTDLPWGVIFPGAAAQDCGPDVLLLCARHPSQLYEAALEGLILGALLLYLVFRRRALHRPWRVTATFFTGYGLARFAVEFVRQPDAQFVSEGNPLGLALHIGGYGLTMGQLLTLPMILIGLWLLARTRAAHD
jgi:phosphatidylglycerol:prolipoprotein diacylglycerol transferase